MRGLPRVLGLLLGVLACGVAWAKGPVVRVLVVTGDGALGAESSAALTRAAGGKGITLTSGDLAWAQSHGAGGGMLPGFNPAPPSGWPEPLRAAWTEGNTACQQRMGPLEGTRKDGSLALRAGTGIECRTQLRAALWNRWLKWARAGEVVEVSLVPVKGEGLTITGDFYKPGESVGRGIVRRGVEPSAAVTTATAVLEELLAGKGEAAQRNATVDLLKAPTASNPDLDRPLPVAKFEPVKVPDGCAGPPAALHIEPSNSAMARALTERYAASVKTASGLSTEPLKCQLTAARGTMGSMMGNSETLAVDLACGGTAHRGEGMLDGPAQRHYGDLITSRIITSILKAHCAKQ